MKKDLLKLLDLSKADIVKILDTADQMKPSRRRPRRSCLPSRLSRRD